MTLEIVKSGDKSITAKPREEEQAEKEVKTFLEYGMDRVNFNDLIDAKVVITEVDGLGEEKNYTVSIQNSDGTKELRKLGSTRYYEKDRAIKFAQYVEQEFEKQNPTKQIKEQITAFFETGGIEKYPKEVLEKMYLEPSESRERIGNTDKKYWGLYFKLPNMLKDRFNIPLNYQRLGRFRGESKARGAMFYVNNLFKTELAKLK